MAVEGVGSTGFVAQTKVVAALRKLEGSEVFYSARRTRLHSATRWEPRIAEGGYAVGSPVHCRYDWRLEGQSGRWCPPRSLDGW